MSDAPVVGIEPLASTLARKWALDVNTGDSTTPVWQRVRAMSEFTPTIDSNLEDDSDYDSGGWGSSTKTMMSWAIDATFVRKVTLDTAVYDPGQEAIRAAADQFGPDATVHVRWYDRTGGVEAHAGYATVSWSPNGGAPSALETVAVTLTGQGERQNITNPLAPAGP